MCVLIEWQGLQMSPLLMPYGPRIVCTGFCLTSSCHRQWSWPQVLVGKLAVWGVPFFTIPILLLGYQQYNSAVTVRRTLGSSPHCCYFLQFPKAARVNINLPSESWSNLVSYKEDEVNDQESHLFSIIYTGDRWLLLESAKKRDVRKVLPYVGAVSSCLTCPTSNSFLHQAVIPDQSKGVPHPCASPLNKHLQDACRHLFGWAALAAKTITLLLLASLTAQISSFVLPLLVTVSLFSQHVAPLFFPPMTGWWTSTSSPWMWNSWLPALAYLRI